MSERTPEERGGLMEIISLAEAKARGEKKYFTGKPCKHGHVAMRLVSDRRCIHCTTQRGASEDFRARTAAWQAANPDRCRQRRLEWRARQRELLTDSYVARIIGAPAATLNAEALELERCRLLNARHPQQLKAAAPAHRPSWMKA